MNEAVIRKYRRGDRDSVRKIAWETAFIGEPGSAFVDNKEILASFLTFYFTDYEPQSCFIAEVNGQAAGYLIGAKNTKEMEEVFKSKIFLPLFLKAIASGGFFRIKNLIFGLNCLISSLRGEFLMPDFSRDYPATLHINIDKNWRNQNIGSRLISAYFGYLVSEKVTGVRLSTMSDKAAGFFESQGFNLLHKSRRTYFHYLLKKGVPVYTYGKKF